MKFFWIVMLFCLLMTSTAQAEKMYVTDKLYITLRTGQSNKFRIIRSLVSGTSVIVLEKNSDTGFTKIKIENGKEGWVLSKYLIPTPTTKGSFEQVQTQNTTINIENKQLNTQLTSALDHAKTMQTELDTLKTNHTELNSQFEAVSRLAERPQIIDRLNQQLTAQNEQLEQTLLRLRADASADKTDDNRNWFMTGAGVLVGGILFGLIVPRLHWRKKSDWSL